MAPWRLAVGQRIAVERSFGGEPLLAARQLSVAAVAIVTRTISIAVEALTTEVAAQSSEAALPWAEPLYVEVALLFAAEPPYVEVARVLPAAESIAEWRAPDLSRAALEISVIARSQ